MSFSIESLPFSVLVATGGSLRDEYNSYDVFYVDKTHPNKSDDAGNPGSDESSPLATIREASRRATAGQIYLVKGDGETYLEVHNDYRGGGRDPTSEIPALPFWYGGNASANAVIANYPGHTVSIQQSGGGAGLIGATNVAKTSAANPTGYCIWDGFTLIGNSTTFGAQLRGVTGAKVKHCTFSNYRGGDNTAAIFLQSCPEAEVSYCDISDVQQSGNGINGCGILNYYAEDILVSMNYFHDLTTYAIREKEYGRRNTYHRNYIESIGRTPFEFGDGLRGEDYVITQNIAAGNGLLNIDEDDGLAEQDLYTGWTIEENLAFGKLVNLNKANFVKTMTARGNISVYNLSSGSFGGGHWHIRPAAEVSDFATLVDLNGYVTDEFIAATSNPTNDWLTLTEWRAQGHDINSVIAAYADRFTSVFESASDFNLRSGSTFKGAGIGGRDMGPYADLDWSADVGPSPM